MYLSAFFSLINSGGYLALQFLNSTWANSEITGESKTWLETKNYYILDSRNLGNNTFDSNRIYIFKDASPVKKYSDSVYLFKLEEILDWVKKTEPEIKFVAVYDSFSDEPYDQNKSAFPVILFKRN